MKEKRRVLVATDLSEGAGEALCEGARLARQSEGRLAVVHVVPTRRARAHAPPFAHDADADALLVGKLARALRRAIRRRLVRVAGSQDAEIFIDEGLDHIEIVKRAADWRADIIVVGGRGRSTLGHLFRGVGERVVREAHCPVLVTRGGHGHGGVLAATDLSKPSLPAVVAGALEAERRGTNLKVVHAVGFLDVEARYLLSLATGRGSYDADFAGLARELEDAVAELGIDQTCEVLDGGAAQAIVRDARAIDAELIVVATRAKTKPGRAVLRSVAEDVVRGAPCSVLVVRAPSVGA